MVRHAREQAVAHLRIARALPLGEPGAGERTPVRAEAQMREIALRIDGGLAGVGELAAGLHGAQRARRLDLLAHEIADAFVGGQVVVEAAVQRGADAQLFGRAAPVLHVVARAQRREAPEVMHVDFARVPRHRLGETERVGAARAQEVHPQPHVGGELGVVPGVAADVVAPLVAIEIVRVHDVAVVPEPVPAALVLLAAVEIEHPVELLLERRVLRRRLRRQRQRVAEHAGFDDSLRRGHDRRPAGAARPRAPPAARAAASPAGSTTAARWCAPRPCGVPKPGS